MRNPPPQPRPAPFRFARKVDPFLAAEVAPKLRAVLLATEKEELRWYGYPDFRWRGTSKINGAGYRAAFDAERKILYLAVTDKAKLFSRARMILGQGDLHVYEVGELLAGKEANAGTLKPAAVIPLGGTLQNLILSPDGKWLYYLDTKNPRDVRLGRIDTGKRVKDKDVGLEEGTQCLCLSPDGKKLYTGTAARGANLVPAGKVRVIDPATLNVDKIFGVAGAPFDIAATDRGMVFYSVDAGFKLTRVSALDVTTGKAVDNWAPSFGPSFIKLAPNQKSLLVADNGRSPPGITRWIIPEKGTDPPTRAGVLLSTIRGPFVGDFFLSPDGRYLLSRMGSVFRRLGLW